MKLIVALFLVGAVSLPSFPAQSDPLLPNQLWKLDVRSTDAGLSIHVAGVPMGRLLAEVSSVTGIEFTLPPEFWNRRVYVSLDNVEYEQAIVEVFAGVSLDYAIIEGQRLVVMGVSETYDPTLNRGSVEGRTAASTMPASSGPPPTPPAAPPQWPPRPDPGSETPQPTTASPQPAFLGNTNPQILDLNRPASGPPSPPAQPPVP